MILPNEQFDFFPPSEGCSEGLDVFRFFFKHSEKKRSVLGAEKDSSRGRLQINWLSIITAVPEVPGRLLRKYKTKLIVLQYYAVEPNLLDLVAINIIVFTY